MRPTYCLTASIPFVLQGIAFHAACAVSTLEGITVRADDVDGFGDAEFAADHLATALAEAEDSELSDACKAYIAGRLSEEVEIAGDWADYFREGAEAAE